MIGSSQSLFNLDPDEFVSWEELCTEGAEVQPLERGTLQEPVVEIDAVDVDDGPHAYPGRKSKGRPLGRPRGLTANGQGEY